MGWRLISHSPQWKKKILTLPPVSDLSQFSDSEPISGRKKQPQLAKCAWWRSFISSCSCYQSNSYRYYWTQVSGDPDNSVTALVRVGLWKQVIRELYPHPRISLSTESPEPTLWDIILNPCCWLKWIYSASGKVLIHMGFSFLRQMRVIMIGKTKSSP